MEAETGKIIPAAGKKPTRGKEYYNTANPVQAGMFSGTATGFLNLITVSLIDNKAVDKVTNLNFTDNNHGFQVTLTKLPESTGFYTDKPDGNDHYTVTNVRMDIVPVQISVTPVN